MYEGRGAAEDSVQALSEPAKQEVTPSFISNQQGGGLGGVARQQDVPSTPGRTDGRTDVGSMQEFVAVEFLRGGTKTSKQNKTTLTER